MWKLVNVFLLILVSGNSWSAPSTKPTDFDRWLNKKVAPELAEKLSMHPKFRGSTLAFAPAHLNQLVSKKSQLHQNIEQILSHSILSAGRNNIASAPTSSHCFRPARSAQYIIGIAITAANSNAHTVQIKVLDHDLGVWVSGISYRWQGQLSRSQRSLFNRKAETLANGSVAAPYARHQQPQTVKHLLRQVECALPAGVEGLIYLSNNHPADVKLAAASIGRELRQNLGTRPQWIFTNQQGEAAWLMELRQEQASQQLPPQWTIVLTPRDKPAANRIIASSYGISAAPNVATLRDTGKVQAEEPVAEYQQAAPVVNHEAAGSDAQELLGQLSWKPSRRCTNKNRDCVEVTVDLQADAYVMLFRTHNRQLKPASCGAPARIRKRGKLHYQISLPRHSPLPTGVYALAGTNKQTFNKLRKTMHAAPGACEGGKDRANSWLTSAEQSTSFQGGFDWQSLHLQTVSGRLREIREAR